MIIYKIQDTGRATDFQYSLRCPEGFKSIPGDKIPEDITPYHEQRYVDAEALRVQKQNIINLVKSAEYHFIPNSRHPDTDGKWAAWVAKLWAIYDGEVVQELPDKPF
jgi:hypothetical protein